MIERIYAFIWLISVAGTIRVSRITWIIKVNDSVRVILYIGLLKLLK